MRFGGQEVANSSDALARHMYAVGWKINPEKV